jgi:hypothetical protein
VDLVSLVQEQLGQVGPILAGDPGDQCPLHVPPWSVGGSPRIPGERGLRWTVFLSSWLVDRQSERRRSGSMPFDLTPAVAGPSG